MQKMLKKMPTKMLAKMMEVKVVKATMKGTHALATAVAIGEHGGRGADAAVILGTPRHQRLVGVDFGGDDNGALRGHPHVVGVGRGDATAKVDANPCV